MNHETTKSWFERLSHFLLREPKDREELIDLLRDATERHLIENEGLKMIEGVLQVTTMKVRDVMIPRSQMVAIEGNLTPKEALPIIIESAHSRFPVIGENREEVIGILLAKDLLQFNLKDPPEELRIRNLVRPAIFIPESKRLDVLLQEFRLNRNHMAIVINEYGATEGLITIEDVLEQIVGDIEDEYDIDIEEPSIKAVSENEFFVKALTSIDDFNAFFGTDYSADDFDTIGGVVLQKFSHFPKRGQTVILGDYKVTVLQATNRGIQLLRFTRISS